MLFKILLLVCMSIGLLVSYKVINLVRCVLQARKIGLPYVLTWTLETETVGYVLTPLLRWIYQDYLLQGKGWPHWCRLMIKDWSFEDKRRAHDEYGEVFLAVSPEGIICYACDAAMGWEVMNKRNEFLKPQDKYKLLAIYGPNVVTTEADEFRFHLRVTAPPFADTSGVNDLVWEETETQTRRLMESWSSGKRGSSTQQDINALTLAVIAKGGFGQDSQWTTDFDGIANSIPPGHTISFLESMTSAMFHMIPALLLPRWLMYWSPLRHAAIAHNEFEKYLREIIREERYKINAMKSYESASARGNLLTSVLKASADVAKEAAQKSSKTGQVKKQALNEDEVMGNLFLFLLAAYETTSNSILYALICLALYPDHQEKIIDEIDRVVAKHAAEGKTKLLYSKDGEKFEYLNAFMYETLRLFPAPQQITKMVPRPTTINVTTAHPDGSSTGTSRPYLLPADCRVYLNVPAVHNSEHYWPDPSKLDPYRWLAPSSSPSPSTPSSGSTSGGPPTAGAPGPTSAPSPTPAQITIGRPKYKPGTFLTFSDGGRACLGRRFAQAEIIAFLVTLLSSYRVKLPEGMTKEEVEREVFWRCKGTLTLTPLVDVMLGLEKR